MTRDEYGAAFQQAYEQTVGSLTARGARYDDARETAQAAWVKGWECISQLRNEKLLSDWVNTIATRLLLTSFRQPRLLDLSQLKREPSVAPSVNVVKIDMRRAMSGCRPLERHSLEAYLDGYSNSELAAQTGKSPAAMHAQAYRARRALRNRMHVTQRQVLGTSVLRTKVHAE